uniref:Uncharacterized protein n=1 Tax=Globodera rostochiensis TaxID=31243 RepID=A0A914H3G2_GLORO
MPFKISVLLLPFLWPLTLAANVKDPVPVVLWHGMGMIGELDQNMIGSFLFPNPFFVLGQSAAGSVQQIRDKSFCLSSGGQSCQCQCQCNANANKFSRVPPPTLFAGNAF